MFPSVIMLHHVSDKTEYASLQPYCISTSKFSQLLDYLDREKIETTTFTAISAGELSTSKKIILTFDDCSKHLLDFAIPELVKRKHTASFYMPTANIGGYNNWDADRGMARVEIMDQHDLVELQKLGMEIGGHSHDHIKLRAESNNKVEYQIEKCKSILETILNKKVDSFAYPFGSVPENYKTILAKNDFKYGLSIFQPFENKFAVRRSIFHNGDTDQSIKQKLSFAYKLYRTFTDPLKG
ncbi:polysaccharide deacetylase family protein [Ferruginibacter sp. SUN002]|uniref:polysaccharide deacetylase family protein n=1 Tax=Ferruginibacter sp. SUN002 TaxID=2937789 RepID=UPI003D36C41E